MLSINHLKTYCSIASAPCVVNRAIKVALVVGSALNLINQWDAIFTFEISHINLTKLFLTYLVPYSVTTYTAAVMKLDFQIGTHSSVDTDLKCHTCGVKVHVNKGELIPECPKCKIFTKWKLQ